MAKRKNKKTKINVIHFNGSIEEDEDNEIEKINITHIDNFFDKNDFFSNDFFEDFEKIFQRMNRIMDIIFRENFNNFDNYNNEVNDIQIIIGPKEESIENNEIEPQERETDAKVVYVNPNKLPRGSYWRALGLYVPYFHTIFIANNLPPRVEKFVYYHEVAHSLGIMNEEEADRYATKKCGYYINLGRRPRRFFCKSYLI